jgi:hypothetical protein
MKRFTDTNKWDKAWFTDLSPKHKCLWFYLCDRCDNAGVWSANFRLASFFIGETITEEDLKVFGERITKIDDDKYYLTSFVEFQVGKLSADCKPHAAIMRRLSELNITTEKKEVVKEASKAAVKPKDENVKEQAKPRKPKSTKLLALPGKYFNDTDVNNAFNEFLTERNAWGKPATVLAAGKLVKKLNRLANGDKHVALEIIDKSIVSRWTDFYQLKNYKQNENNYGRITESEVKQFIGESDS